MGTDHGLDLLESGSWRHYDTGEGMLSNDTNEKAVFADADGSFWIGSTGGLSHLTLPTQPAALRPITTTLTEASWAGMPLPLDRQERLEWRSGDLTVRFAVLSFRNQDAICFRYRLLGLEEEWVSTRDHSVRYAKLPPGKYRFEVVSEDSGLHQTSQPASFSFEVTPPWWRRWYFFAVCALLVGGLVVAIWRLRVHQLVATQAKLERTVRDRTRALEEERVLLLVARDALKQQATHDSLTGLWNRRAISDALSREWQRACREHVNLLVVIADLDHFKGINDTYGHPGGDEVLVQAGQCLQSNIREYDALGRYGGEEFMLVLTEGEWEDWSARVNRIRESIARERFLVAGNDDQRDLQLRRGGIYAATGANSPARITGRSGSRPLPRQGEWEEPRGICGSISGIGGERGRGPSHTTQLITHCPINLRVCSASPRGGTSFSTPAG